MKLRLLGAVSLMLMAALVAPAAGASTGIAERQLETSCAFNSPPEVWRLDVKGVRCATARTVSSGYPSPKAGFLCRRVGVYAGGITVRCVKRFKGNRAKTIRFFKGLNPDDPLRCWTTDSVPERMEFLDNFSLQSRCYVSPKVLLEAQPIGMDGLPSGNWRQISAPVYAPGFLDLLPPAPGRWQVRITSTSSSMTSEARSVTVGAPSCDVGPARVGQHSSGAAVYQCTLVSTTWLDEEAPTRYILQWLGSGLLQDVSTDRLAVYFHGDGGCCFDGWDRGVGKFAIDRGMVIVYATSPRRPDRPAWGATYSETADSELGYRVGYELSQVASAAKASRFMYWSASGGSWFLSSNFIPTGLTFAPGPLALNCGGAPPSSAFVERVPISVRNLSPIGFFHGSEDFLTDEVSAALTIYQSLSWPDLHREVFSGEGHCGRSFHDENIAWFSQNLRRLSSIPFGNHTFPRSPKRRSTAAS